MTCITIDESCNKYEDVETRDCITSNPELGMIYFDTNSKRLKLYDGTGWYAIALEKVSSVSRQQVKETIKEKGEVKTCS